MIGLISFSACDMLYSENDVPQTSDDEFGTGPAIFTSDPSGINDHTLVPGSEFVGSPPGSSNIRYPPRIFNHTPTIASTKDQLIFLPFGYECSPHAKKPEVIFFQIEGSGRYWKVQPAVGNGVQGDLHIAVVLPGNIQNGSFMVNYRIKDDLGFISNVLSTEIRIVDVAVCDGAEFTGEDGLTVRSYDMGNSATTARVTYDMVSIPDRIDIFYAGRWIAGTGSSVGYGELPPQSKCTKLGNGYVSGDGFFDISYDPKVSRRIDIYVSGCRDGGTSWSVWVECF